MDISEIQGVADQVQVDQTTQEEQQTQTEPKNTMNDDDDSGSDLDIDMDNLPLELRAALFPEEAAQAGIEVPLDSTYDSDFSDDSDDEAIGTIDFTGDYKRDKQSILALMAEVDEDGNTAGEIRSANEISPDKVPIEAIEYATDKGKLLLAGSVLTILKNTCIVQSTNDKGVALDLNTPIFDMNGTPIGRVDDVIGNINDPHYVIRAAQTIPLGQVITPETMDVALTVAPSTINVTIEQQLYYYVGSKFVTASKIHIPGSDASNVNDDEQDKDMMEFSDDEAESKHKQTQKKLSANRNKKRQA